MRKRIGTLISTLSLVVIIGAIFFAGKPFDQKVDAQQKEGFAMYYLWVFCDPSQVANATFAVKGTGLMGTHVACAGWCTDDGGIKRKVMIADALAKLPPRVSTALSEKLRLHERDAAIGIGHSIAKCITPEKPKPPCEKYTGEIACDCNGDGQDDATKSFESCGDPSSHPREFKSRCEDWVRGERNQYFFGQYPTDPLLAREAGDWLKSLKCPTLKCRGEYAQCMAYAESEYQKCVERRKFSPLRPNCLARLTAANKKCEQARNACMSRAARSGSASASSADNAIECDSSKGLFLISYIPEPWHFLNLRPDPQ